MIIKHNSLMTFISTNKNKKTNNATDKFIVYLKILTLLGINCNTLSK